MTLHIMKLCVGVETVEDLADWQKGQLKKRKRVHCGTRMWPKRVDDVLAGGSLYWVIKGVILVRQKIIAIEEVSDDHGVRCGLFLEPPLIRTAPQPRRAFQGWRYLEAKDAPADIGALKGGTDLPDHLRRQLVEIGAW